VVYASSSSALATGSALNFDGSALSISATDARSILKLVATTATNPVYSRASNTGGFLYVGMDGSGGSDFGAGAYASAVWSSGAYPMVFGTNGTERMRISSATGGVGAVGIGYSSLTSVGDNGLAVLGNVGIGTSSPSDKLHVVGTGTNAGSGYLVSRFMDSFNGKGVFLGYDTDEVAGTIYGVNFLTFQTYNGTSWGERMRLDASGNLGLGVTPSAWGGGFSGVLEVKNAGSALASGGSGNTSLWANSYYTSGVLKYAANGLASNYTQDSGQHIWSTAPNNTSGAGATLAFTQAMTLDASGNLGVGETSPTFRISVKGDTSVKSGMNFKNTVQNQELQIGCSSATTDSFFLTTSNSPIYFGTNNTERARIDSGGNLLVGCTSDNPGIGNTVTGVKAGGNLIAASRASNFAAFFNRNTDDGGVIWFGREGNQVGSISVTTTATAYNTSSDYRLKNTIAPMTGALAKVALLKPCTYKWNVNGSDGEGFIAHELAEVVPHAVTGAKDAIDENGKPKYQGMDVSFLVATLTAAIQEQQAMIESLKARLDAANL
jgi:hypothetical protein